MPALPQFGLEALFSRWEFTARHVLTASDAQTLSLAELLELADADGRRRWEQLHLGYTETWGLPALREAIAGTYATIDAADVLCFAGAEEGLYLAMQTLLGPADHAVVLTPNYQSAETVPASICPVTGVPLTEGDWTLDVAAVEAALRPNTRLVSVSFPNNPTGAVPDPASWQALVALCAARGVLLFSDEVHRGIGQLLPAAADLSPSALSLGVLSKAYGLPGLRVGWIACRDRALLARLEQAKHYTTICNAAPSEVLALIALRAAGPILARTNAIVARNAGVVGDFFGRHAELYDWAPPAGGCVCFPRYRGAEGVEVMCRELVEQEGVLLAPASVFASALGPTPTDRFRVGLGRLDPEPALERWDAWLRSR